MMMLRTRLKSATPPPRARCRGMLRIDLSLNHVRWRACPTAGQALFYFPHPGQHFILATIDRGCAPNRAYRRYVEGLWRSVDLTRCLLGATTSEGTAQVRPATMNALWLAEGLTPARGQAQPIPTWTTNRFTGSCAIAPSEVARS